MEELLIAPPTTALESEPQRIVSRPNHLLQGVLAFLAVVGIGATITVLLSPPVQVRVITVDKTKPPEIHYVERVIEKTPVILPPAQRQPKHAPIAQQTPKPRPMPNSADCKNDPLCGIDTSKQ